MYPHLTERMLHQSAALAPLGEIAVQHRERLDGSGYPARSLRRRDLAARPGAGGGGRIPVHVRVRGAPGGPAD